MKTREGVPEKQAYGLKPAAETHWIITTKPGALLMVNGFMTQAAGNLRVTSTAPTAFLACQRVGMTLGQCADIVPCGKEIEP